jgi:ADP-ribose pyrophosphatase YjhB (NUDIX family)
MIKTPYLAVDGIIKLYDENENFKGIVLIERLNRPLGVAIPGGFVDIGETVENAVIREMKEETTLRSLDRIFIKLHQNIYSLNTLNDSHRKARPDFKIQLSDFME